MANTINADASNQARDVDIFHNQIVAYINFIANDVESKIGTEYSGALEIPARAQRLIAADAAFTAKGHAGSITKKLLENNFGYDNWAGANTTDVSGLVAGAATIRDAIEAMTADFPASYDANHKMVYVTASAGAQAALQAAINAALNGFVLGRA